ncbi:MAG: hypothetical protein ACK58L_12430 [Planctomycetota bacterium]
MSSSCFNSTPRSWKPYRLVVSLVVILVLGCGKGAEPWEKTYPVKGVISFRGKPLADAELSFFPEDQSYPDLVRPRARSGADGSVVGWTYEQGDGAPAALYKVTVVHHEVGVSKETVITKPNDLPEKYSKLDTTDLTVEIRGAENVLPPIDLK